MPPDDLQAALTAEFARLVAVDGGGDWLALLRRSCHDLNNSLGTLALEHFSVRAIIEESMTDPEARQEALEALDNAEAGREFGVKLVAALHQALRDTPAG